MLFGLTVLSASLLFACQNSRTKSEAKVEKLQDTTESAVPTTATDVSFKDKSGNVVQLNDLKGKVVFINFWATWCPPCIHELPSIDQLRQSLKDNKDIVFLMVDVDGDIDKSSAFME